MGKFLHLYDAISAFTQDYNGEAYVEPWVSYTEENEHVDYNKVPLIKRIWETYGNQNPYPDLVAVVQMGNYYGPADVLLRKGTGVFNVTAGTIANVPVKQNYVVNQYTGEEEGLKFVSASELSDSDIATTEGNVGLVFLWSDDTPLDVTPTGEWGCYKCMEDQCFKLLVETNGTWTPIDSGGCTNDPAFCAIYNNKKYVFFDYAD